MTNLESHPFTGLFTGADSGVVRLSFAGQPDITIQHTTPAMAIKFLRDGVDSANVVASQSVDGQDSWNFFEFDFSNHLPQPTNPDLAPLGAKFSTATNYIQSVAVSSWAQFDQNGTAVESPIFPFKLRFHPTGEF